MKSFSYVSAPNEAEAVKLLSEKALPLAGGTNLLNLMKDYVLQPEVVVNVKAVAGTSAIEGDAAKGLRIGANVTLAEILEHAVVRKSYPALIEALLDVGTPQIRNMSTLGGNLCARPSCWYFRSDAFNCRKKGGPACPAEGGENEQLSILGHDGLKCHAVHASSAAPPLVAYGARLRIAGPAGAREIPIEEFFVLPDEAHVRRENVLGANEIVTHAILPAHTSRSATYEAREKESHDWPMAMASVALMMAGETIQEARIVLGAVAPVPWRAKASEAALKGQKLTAELAAAAAEKAVEGAKPMERNGHKLMITKTVVRRALLLAGGLLQERRA